MSEIKVGDRAQHGADQYGRGECVVLAIDEPECWLKDKSGTRFTAPTSQCRPVPKPFAEVRKEGNDDFGLYVGGVQIVTGYMSDKTPKPKADAINAVHAAAVKAAVESALGGKS